MNEIKVENSISIPARAGAPTRYEYPIEEMKVGSSILLSYDHLNVDMPFDEESRKRAETKARGRVRLSANRKGFNHYKLTAQCEERGVRVWVAGISKPRVKRTENAQPAQAIVQQVAVETELDGESEE